LLEALEVLSLTVLEELSLESELKEELGLLNDESELQSLSLKKCFR
jgi:hypothetical protein